MDVIVMAAGEGRRLRPLTEVWPKPILPIDGRPIIATLLRELAAGGLTRVTIVTGHLAAQVEALVGDGAAFDIEVRYARQPDVIGSGDAVRRALEAGAEAPAVVTAADTVYRRGDVRLFAEAFAASGAAGGICVRRDPPAGPERPPVRMEDWRVTRIVDDDAANPLGSAPLWALGPELVPHLEGLSGPPYELAEGYQRAIDAGAYVMAFEIGPTRDLTRPVDLVRLNFPYLSEQA